jgi:hypothetical protein
MKLSILAVLLLTGCATKKPAQAHLVAPPDCVKHIKFTEPCVADGKTGMWCNKVHAELVCVKVAKQ